MTKLTSSQIHDAINAWAESQVDASIAESIKDNKEYNEKYGGRTVYSYGGYRGEPKKVPYPTTPEEFDREEVASQLAESFYEAYDFPESVELPGLGTATLVDSYGGEGMGEELWIVVKIGDQHYKFDHYYSSYDGTEPWHGNCTIFPVTPKEVTVTQWAADK